jgi:hypothetical protein
MLHNKGLGLLSQGKERPFPLVDAHVLNAFYLPELHRDDDDKTDDAYPKKTSAW